MDEIVLAEPQLLNRNAAAIHIASPSAETGRQTQAQALHVIAGVLGTDFNHVAWENLRYQHTAAIRAKIGQIYKPTTGNTQLVFQARRRSRYKELFAS